MGREQAAGRGAALAAAIEEAHRELKATWAEARKDARHLGTA
jgi:hypothetical protein